MAAPHESESTVTHPRRRSRAAALAVGAAFLFLAACSGGGSTPTATAPATVAPTAPSTATATAPSTRTATPVKTATATPSAVATLPPLPSATAPAGPTPPAGYAQSCAADHPWAEQVDKPFVCIDAPAPGAVLPAGTPLEVRGFAGGSFESHVLVEVRAVNADGTVADPALVSEPLTYIATDVGMPGWWSTTIDLPTGAPPRLRVIASFTSPRDGSVVAQASVDIQAK